MKSRRFAIFFLVVWLLALAAWAWSYHSIFNLEFPVRAGHTRLQIYANQGLILFLFTGVYAFDDGGKLTTGPYPDPPAWDFNYWRDSTLGFSDRTTRVPLRATMDKTGFIIMSNTPWGDRRRVGVPYWSFAAAATVPLLVSASIWRRRRRRLRVGHCANCGYDLRASPERCPECGTPVADSAVRGVAHSGVFTAEAQRIAR